MARERNLWYQLGYSLERAKGGASTAAPTGEPPAEPERAAPPVRSADGSMSETRSGGALHPLVEKALATAAVAGGGAVIATALRVWRPRYRAGPLDLIRAGAAGAGAAVGRMVVRHLINLPGPKGESTDPIAPILAGAARGVIYAQVLDPRLPGPPLLRGVSYGALEFAAAPWGGLEGLLDSLPAHRRVPFLAALLDARDDDSSLAGHLLFGALLSSLYGDTPSGR